MPAVTTPLRGRATARAAAALLAGTTMLLTGAPTRAMAQDQCPGANAVPSAQTLDQAAGAVVCLVNAERARHDLRPLDANNDLGRAAERHSQDMVRRAFFSHVTPTGGDLSDRLRRSGYSHGNGAWHGGEALAWGTGTLATPEATVAGWIASPPHHRVLLGRNVRDVGVGVAAAAPQPSTGGHNDATYTLDTGAIGG